MDINYYKQYEPIFGVWRITRLIGEGSFGKVFEMEREDFGQVYKAALKAITIPASQSEVRSVRSEGMDEESVRATFHSKVQELVKEFALMSKLKGNSNVVSYENHQVIEHKDNIGWDILIQMELLTPLDEYIQKKKSLPRQEIIKLGIDLCKALELCQKHNIIHRDIKPENTFISENGDFKLGDFGVARTIEKTTGGLSKQGSYPYMAPEIYNGKPYGTTVDIYSLGLILYRLLNGNRLPFLPAAPAPITYADRENAMARRFNGAPLPMPSHADGRLGEIVLKACAFEPKDRYSSPGQMRQELEAILYNKEEGKYIYPDGDEIRQDSIHSSKGDDEPPIRQEGTVSDFGGTVSDFGGTVSDFGKTVSDFGGTVSDFGHELEKENAETLSAVPKWEATGFQFLIQGAVSADRQKALVSGVVRDGPVKRGDRVFLLWPNGAYHPVTVGNISRAGWGETDRAEPGESVQLELRNLPMVDPVYACSSCGTKIRMQNPSRTSVVCPKCGGVISFWERVTNRPMGEPVAQHDVLVRLPAGQHAKLERISDANVNAPEIGLGEYTGRRYKIHRYDELGRTLRRTWYEDGERLEDRIFYLKRGEICRAADFDRQMQVTAVYDLTTERRLVGMQMFRSGQLRYSCGYDYDDQGRNNRCVCFGPEGQMRWYYLISYDKAGKLHSQNVLNPQGEILVRQSFSSGVTEYLGRNGQLTADRASAAFSEEELACMENAYLDLFEWQGLEANPAVSERRNHQTQTQKEDTAATEPPRVSSEERFDKVFEKVVQQFFHGPKSQSEVLSVLRELLPSCTRGLAKCVFSPDIPQKELRVYREKMIAPTARRYPAAEGQDVLGILRQSGNLLSLGNPTALARSLLFLEKGLVTLAWTKTMTFQVKDAEYCYIPYEDMRQLECRKDGPYRWLEIAAPGAIFRLGTAWCNQDQLRDLLVRLST